MGAFGDLADRLARLGATGHARALDASAIATHATLETALAPHRRTGNAADTLTVTVDAGGFWIDSARYTPFIKGVPKLDELKQVAADAYGAAVRAEIAEVAS